MTTKSPDFREFRWIVINSSGGKDSQTALAKVVERADIWGIPRDRLVVSHQCLGQMEWKGTREVAAAQAACYGLRFEVSKYRTKAGASPTLLDYVRLRGMWPSNTQRYCTSEFKRGPGGRVLTMLYRESPGAILNVFGFRASESPARAKKVVLVKNTRFSTAKRLVMDWLPIHEWTDEQVWAHVKESGVPYHYAYDLGMPRLSCVFCIFAPRAALLVAGQHNPELLAEYVAVERETGHDFQNGKPIESIQEAIARGEKPATGGSGAWNM